MQLDSDTADMPVIAYWRGINDCRPQSKARIVMPSRLDPSLASVKYASGRGALIDTSKTTQFPNQPSLT